MLELRCIEQLALCIQIFKYQRICVFYEFSGIRGLCGQITLAVYELYEGEFLDLLFGQFITKFPA